MIVSEEVDLEVGPDRAYPQQHQQKESGPMLTNVRFSDFRLTLAGEEAQDDDDDRDGYKD